MDISIIVPLFNEAESLPKLYEWIAKVMDEHKFSYEIIFVNDGSTDISWQVIQDLKRQAARRSKVSALGVTTANPLPCIVVSKPRKDKWLLRWMPTCKTRPTRFPNSIG